MHGIMNVYNAQVTMYKSVYNIDVAFGKYITVKEAAEESGTSVDTIRRACRLGHIKGVKQIGMAFLIPRDAFNEWKGKPRKQGRPSNSEKARGASV